MRSLYDFFVKMPKAFNDEVKVGDTSIYIDPKWNEFNNRKQSAEVVAVPEKYDTPVKVGDTIFFHHHVVISNNGNGQRVDGDIYAVRFDPNNGHGTQAYAYKCQETGDIELLSDWVFLIPEEQEAEETTDSGIIVALKEPEYNQYGYVLYDSPAVQQLGLKAGDKVMIMKNADYKMEIDGQEVYRVHIDHIYATGF
jgi:co-chaperonin GroES (HSP10)